MLEMEDPDKGICGKPRWFDRLAYLSTTMPISGMCRGWQDHRGARCRSCDTCSHQQFHRKTSRYSHPVCRFAIIFLQYMRLFWTRPLRGITYQARSSQTSFSAFFWLTNNRCCERPSEGHALHAHVPLSERDCSRDGPGIDASPNVGHLIVSANFFTPN